MKGAHVLQLMVLLDSGERIGIGDLFNDLKTLVNALPPSFEVGVGYLLQGNVKVAQPPTTDRTLFANALHVPTEAEVTDPKNDNGNPFSCLDELSAHWPNADPSKLRAVLMFTDGIIRSNAQSQNGDQLNPDVDGASQSLQHAEIVPYSFYYMDPVPPRNRTSGGTLEGQQNFNQLSADTGGAALYEGQYAPSSFRPLLNRLYVILQSEVVVTVDAVGKPGQFKNVDIKTTRPQIKATGAEGVTIGNILKK
jgi:hypothetical protein